MESLGMVDDALALFGNRSLVEAREVVDTLLDLRLQLTAETAWLEHINDKRNRNKGEQ